MPDQQLNHQRLRQEVPSHTRLIGKTPLYFHYKPETQSTNDDAKEWLKEIPEEGHVFLSDFQNRGRGRLDRGWESPPCKNICFSLLLKPSLPQETLSLFAYVMATSIHQTLKDYLPPILLVKWPNDLYAGACKLSGILNEMLIQNNEPWIISGVGININVDREHFSQEIHEKATSLKILRGKEFAREPILTELIKHIDHNYEQFNRDGAGFFIDYVNQHSFLNGKQVRVLHEGTWVKGQALQINQNGHLEIRSEGKKISLINGDVWIGS